MSICVKSVYMNLTASAPLMITDCDICIGLRHWYPIPVIQCVMMPVNFMSCWVKLFVLWTLSEIVTYSVFFYITSSYGFFVNHLFPRKLENT